MLHFRIISVSAKPPAWVNAGFQEYVKRLSGACTLELIDIPVEKRFKQKNIQPFIEREGERILATIKPNHQVIALDRQGKMWSTEDLARHFQDWQLDTKRIDFIIGGPDGLSNTCLKRAEMTWSLSALTLPHLMVRIVIAEQLYRAWTILQGHPYHK